MRQGKEKFLLYSGACAALLPILLLRDFTPANELRYLSIADEALRDNTFFAFTNHGVPYADKTPLYFWIIMLCKWLAGSHKMWILSLFSLIPALTIVRIMDKWTVAETDSECRSIARMMLITCGLFLGAAFILRMDMLMCMFIVLALRSFWMMSAKHDNGSRERWLFPVWLFLAVFTKGPMGLLVPLASTAVYLTCKRRPKEFFRYWGWRTWGVLSVCFGLWFGAVYAEGGSVYLHNMLLQQTIGRAVNSFHHAEPFYYYALCIWYCLAPWSPLAVGMAAAALRPKFVRSDLQRFFLCIGITTVALLSCISSKLEIYMLPAIPFIIYSTAIFLPRFRSNKWISAVLAIPAAAFALALPALVAMEIWGEMPYLNEGMLYAAATILTLCGTHSLYLLYIKERGMGQEETETPFRPAVFRESMPKNGEAGGMGREYKRQDTDYGTVIRQMGAELLLALFVGGWTLPKLNNHIGYGALCRKVMKVSDERSITTIRTWRLSRPENMDVYLHHPIENTDSIQPSEHDGKPFLLLTRSRYMAQFPEKEAIKVGPYAVIIYH